jgi:phosphate transport system protein
MGREDLDRQLTALRTSIEGLATFVDSLLERALASVASNDAFDARIAQSREDEFDRTCEAIEDHAISMLTLQQPVVAQDLRLVVAAVVVAQRLQRVGHNALGTAGIAIDLAALGAPEVPPPALLALGAEARTMLRDAVRALLARDAVAGGQIVARDSVIDADYHALRDDLLARMSAAEADQRRLTFWIWVAHKLERVADHAVVIARRAGNLGT